MFRSSGTVVPRRRESKKKKSSPNSRRTPKSPDTDKPRPWRKRSTTTVTNGGTHNRNQCQPIISIVHGTQRGTPSRSTCFDRRPSNTRAKRPRTLIRNIMNRRAPMTTTNTPMTRGQHRAEEEVHGTQHAKPNRERAGGAVGRYNGQR